MNRPWKLIVLLIGIFLAGGATAVLVTHRVRCKTPDPAPVSVSPSQPPSPEKWTKGHLKTLKEQVLVDDAQLEIIRPIVAQRMQELFAMRAKYLDENRTHRRLMESEVAEKLTPEQREKYERLNAEYHERAKKIERGEKPPSLSTDPSKK